MPKEEREKYTIKFNKIVLREQATKENRRDLQNRGGQGTFRNTLCGGGVVGGVVSDPQNGENSKSTQGTF